MSQPKKSACEESTEGEGPGHPALSSSQAAFQPHGLGRPASEDSCCRCCLVLATRPLLSKLLRQATCALSALPYATLPEEEG